MGGGVRLVEHAVTLNIEQLIRERALTAGARSSGELTWTFPSGEAGSACFEALLAAPGYLQLDFEVREEGSETRRPIRQKISLATTKLNFGGVRWWFVCPAAGKRVGRLHLPSDGGIFASRQAHGLTYACQNENVYARARRRSLKVLSRLGVPQGDGGPLYNDAGWPLFVLKPKGMRWETYGRCLDEVKRFNSIANCRFVRLTLR